MGHYAPNLRANGKPFMTKSLISLISRRSCCEHFLVETEKMLGQIPRTEEGEKKRERTNAGKMEILLKRDQRRGRKQREDGSQTAKEKPPEWSDIDFPPGKTGTLTFSRFEDRLFFTLTSGSSGVLCSWILNLDVYESFEMLPLLLSDLTNAGKKERRAIKRFPLKGSTTFLTNSTHNSAASFRAETNPPSVSIQAGPQNLFPRVTKPLFPFHHHKSRNNDEEPFSSWLSRLRSHFTYAASEERSETRTNEKSERSFNAQRIFLKRSGEGKKRGGEEELKEERKKGVNLSFVLAFLLFLHFRKGGGL